MKTEVVKVVSNDIARFVVSTNGNSFKVSGTGMLKPRSFPNSGQAIEFAQDKLLILTLENEKAIESN